MIKNVKIVIIYASFCISLIFMYCLFVEKKLVTIKHFLLNLFLGVKMSDKMAISAYILKIVEKNPFLRLQTRASQERQTSRVACVGFNSKSEDCAKRVRV